MGKTRKDNPYKYYKHEGKKLRSPKRKGRKPQQEEEVYKGTDEEFLEAAALELLTKFDEMK